ncbi:hypothetical protein BDQ12DRAFT_679352 [Crucibulum laeve]|uniref:SAGA-associated factor 11 n=1 Tax=Crucibulum laeve TaxID=68775 RepID=A0A5C3MC08_9AGAR|nr:hypothetical protein BDQ12DRAFT_679352 [Crucibulum laeve]
MPKSEREETLSALTTRIFSAMLDDLVLDAVLQSHHEVARSRAVCHICHTQCGSVHTPASMATASQASANGASSSRADTPSSTGEAKPGINGSAGTSTPTSAKDGNLYLECISCARPIASNRYAPHLSSCLGLSTSRRGPTRNNTKKAAPDIGRSASPVSEAGSASDTGKSKGKSKSKRTDESDFNLKRKRMDSPQISPNKKQKKTTAKASGSPVSRVKADPDASGVPSNSHYSPSTGSQSKVPSKLRDSSTASFLERSSTSSSSRSPSPGGGSIGTAASSFSQSPNLTARAIGNGRNVRGRATGIGPPKRPSPARPPPIQVPSYIMDVDGGDETGSSTDTDSSS